MSSLRILWVKSGPLLPLNTGGRRRTHAMLCQLAREHEVTYLALKGTREVLNAEEESSPYAQEKIWVPADFPAEKTPRFFLALLKNFLLSPLPYVLDRYRSETMRDKLTELDQSGNYDLIVCDFLTPAVNFDFNSLQTPAVLFQHNIEAQIWKRLAREKQNPITRIYFYRQYLRMRKAEKNLSKEFKGVITVSPEDAQHCLDEYQLKNVLGAVPTGVDAEYFRPPDPRTPKSGLIGFLGSMDWMPNIECVQYFVRDIFPAILEKYPEATFRIIGRDPAPEVLALAENRSNIEVTGTVEDVRPHLDECAILVVPLRSGGGTRIKIFEAMAQGVPVVSTTIGAEGLPVTDGETIRIADQTADFITAVTRLLSSPGEAEALAEKARNMVEGKHSWASVSQSFIDLCNLVNGER